jgi:hypothetical protein
MSAFADGSRFLPDRVSTFEMEQLYSVVHAQLLSSDGKEACVGLGLQAGASKGGSNSPPKV